VVPPLASDTFDGSSLGSDWTTNAGTWQVANGVLSQTSLDYADPKKATLSVPTSSQDVMITAKVMVNPGSDVSQTRAGVGLSTDANGRGYNMIFYGRNTVAFLNDGVAWGNGYNFDWSVGTWYWFKLERVGDNLYGKVWADGTAEPSDWMFTQTGWGDRTTGSPGLNGGTVQSSASFDDVSIVSSVDATTDPSASTTESGTTTTIVETTRLPDEVSSESGSTTATTVPVVTMGGGSGSTAPVAIPTPPLTPTPSSTLVVVTPTPTSAGSSNTITEESTAEPTVSLVDTTPTDSNSDEPVVATSTTPVTPVSIIPVTTRSTPSPVVTVVPPSTSSVAATTPAPASVSTTTTPTSSTNSSAAPPANDATPAAASSTPSSAFRFMAGMGRNLKSKLASLGGRKYGPKIVVRAMPTGHHLNAAGNRNAIAAKSLGHTGVQTAKRPTPKPIGWPKGHG
ncbi:hypothetical protein ACYOEI_08090, partial [Singulisphaera rosea]